MDELAKIREAEKASHIQAYNEYELYAPGSWLAKPVKTVLDLIPLFEDYREFRALDLGCGVGRNSIALAGALAHCACEIDCVDILPLAIEKLHENAARYRTEGIHGVVASIDDYEIQPAHYDLILGISALEHMDSEQTFLRKLEEIWDGVREKGVVCLIVNSNVEETDKETGERMPAQFEVNLPTEEMLALLRKIFADREIIREKIIHQSYEIPRGKRTSALETDVVTWVARRK